ncbi:hypothetical protein JOM49_007593 [Amycolatopsis magusensis]|uniref:Uncharacterized protein n=1 Tax=Amycolatopsis magusensis TaxID=882444 RepID=A0ABS4Q303_9PSEU|nr:hypothetical protein [Amycolatopsis magusensis]
MPESMYGRVRTLVVAVAWAGVPFGGLLGGMLIARTARLWCGLPGDHDGAGAAAVDGGRMVHKGQSRAGSAVG